MAKVSVNNNLDTEPQNLTSSFMTILSAGNTSSNVANPRRGKIYEMSFGTSSVPSDDAIIYDLSLNAPMVITNAGWNAGAITFNTATGFNLVTGDFITTTGFEPSGYNGNWTISNTNNPVWFQVNTSNPGSIVTLGTAYYGGGSQTVTPVNVDLADGEALCTYFSDYYQEPLVLVPSSAFYIALNTRASFRWQAAPGREIVFPAINNYNYCFRAKSASYTGFIAATMFVDEQ